MPGDELEPVWLQSPTMAKARSVRSFARRRLPMVTSRRNAVRAKPVRGSALVSTTCTSVVTHPASEAARSNSHSKAVFATPRSPV